MKDYEVKQVKYQSDLYRKVVRLRQKVLREPLHLKLTENDLANDKNEIILAVIKSGELVACVQLKPLNKKQLKLRQMAVDERFQGQKIGSFLIQEAENTAKESAYKEIILHARKSAEYFYKKSGYITISEEFMEIGIPHVKMQKNIDIN